MLKTTARPRAAASWLDLWRTGKTLKSSFAEQMDCIREVYYLLDETIQTPNHAPASYRVTMGTIPDQFYTLRKNIFSTLFHTSYHLLDLPRERRLLYGKLNHLFRIWVTSADNLLDEEDKEVVPLTMPGQSPIMRQVVAIMAADRVLKKLLDEAVNDEVINADQARQLADSSLQVLLPSAALEASEEGGLRQRPAPAYVLSTIHVLKTGILFHVPFLGPDLIEPQIDQRRLAELKQALLHFGLGCQLLDDLRDLARDFIEGRHNYVLSTLEQQQHPILQTWRQRPLTTDARLYQEVPQASLPTVRLALQYLKESLTALKQLGLGIPLLSTDRMACSMLTILDLEDLRHAC